MVEQDYRVVMSGTYKEGDRIFSPLKIEKDKSEKKTKSKVVKPAFKN